MTPPPRRIAVLGLGLIGGSIGLALGREGRFDGERVGYDPGSGTADRARERGAIDRPAAGPAEAVREADLILLAAPVLAIEGLLAAIAPHVPAGATVTDTASTKSGVVRWAADRLPDSVDFVAGHPLAGREIQGIAGALADLFEGCTYCLIPGKASAEAVGRVRWLIAAVGGRPLEVDAAEHDQAAAGISHLPLLLSAALTGCTTADPGWPLMSRLAASGYRDVSRLASGDPRMGRDICLSNATAIVEWIDRFTADLGHLRDRIAAGDPAIESIFAERKALRDAWIDHVK